MNKKLFFAGFALLAAVSFTSCNSDNPIDVTDPNGVRPVNSAHYLGGSYDWTAVVKDYAQLQEFWAADKDAVKKALADSKANKVNILLDVSNYELKNEVITLPDFWQTGATNGKVVNITFQGNFKNADFERAAQIKGGTITKFPVKVNTDNLKSAEINFTFNVEKFDLVLETRQARSTFAGAYTIGYMKADADVNTQDAIEVKEGTVEGLDVESTGNYKGTIDALWTKTADNNLTVAENTGLILSIDNGATKTGKISGIKNLIVEKDVNLVCEYWKNSKWNSYKLGTIKYVAQAEVDFINCNLDPAVEKVIGFDKSKCKLMLLASKKGLQKIEAIEKVTVDGYTAPYYLTQDVYTDVKFDAPVEFWASDVATFENVTFNAVAMNVDDDNQTLTFKSVNFWQPVDIQSDIYVEETVKTTVTTYQWIIDNNSDPINGHFQEVTNAAPLTEANKTKEVKKYNWDNVRFNGVNFSGVNGYNVTEANSSYVVEITHNYKKGETYIPDGTNVVLDEKCKFSDLGGTVGTPELQTSNYALNRIWGNKVLWDEQCWYNLSYAGVPYMWKKVSGGIFGAGTAGFILAPIAAE